MSCLTSSCVDIQLQIVKLSSKLLTCTIRIMLQAFDNSQDPKMFDLVLEAINNAGNTIHASKIQKAYYEGIDKHKLCTNCRDP